MNALLAIARAVHVALSLLPLSVFPASLLLVVGVLGMSAPAAHRYTFWAAKSGRACNPFDGTSDAAIIKRGASICESQPR
jgi:hypothetical protein